MIFSHYFVIMFCKHYICCNIAVEFCLAVSFDASCLVHFRSDLENLKLSERSGPWLIVRDDYKGESKVDPEQGITSTLFRYFPNSVTDWCKSSFSYYCQVFSKI